MKKNISLTFFLILSLFLLYSCGSGSKNTWPSTGYSAIDLRHYSQNIVPTLPLSDAVSKLEVIPLETKEECMITEVSNIWITGHDIIIYHHYKQPLLRFSRDGKFRNKIGIIGKGPGECPFMGEVAVNEPAQEVYINLGDGIKAGFMVYGFDGKFKRKISFNTHEQFATLTPQLFFINGTPWFRQDLPVMNPEVSMWNFAQLDTSLQTIRTYSNAQYKGREKELAEKCCLYYGWAQYYIEHNAVNPYKNEFKILYHGADTIYQYQPDRQTFQPVYSIQQDSRPSFSKSRDWIKDEDFFSYLWVSDFYDTRDYLYLNAAQNKNGYLIRFGKQDGSLAVLSVQGEIIRYTFPNGWIHKRRKIENLGLTNDLCGYPEIFIPRPLDNGKHWVATVNSYQLLTDLDPSKLKQTEVKNTDTRDRILEIAATLTEESNPVIFLAEIK